MPAQHYSRKAGLKRTPRQGLPEPGVGGYGYPRGPFGATGYPGSTPATLGRVKRQDREGRKDPQFRNRPTITASGIRARDTGPEFLDPTPVMTPKPQPSYGEVRFRPGTSPRPGNRFIRENGSPRQPFARLMRATRPEHRMTPVIGGIGQRTPKDVRNDVAQRWKADPLKVRGYRPSPNPGLAGARGAGPSRYHPGTTVYGNPGADPGGLIYHEPPEVVVQSRYVSHEGSQEGYAMNREMLFTKGGTPAAIPHGAAPHIRGGRYSGQRYFGAITDQQRIGLPSDSYGIARARGPRHRPVSFVRPAPWTANYYDVAPAEGTQSPDMIHRSAKTRARGRSVRRG